MSQFNNNTNTSSGLDSAAPAHHIHSDADPISQKSADYSADKVERSGIPQDQPSSEFSSAGGETGRAGPGRSTGQGQGQAEQTGQSAFTSERPLGVQPTSAGGVAIGGREDLPEGKASMMDKVMGKTEKVMGKMTKNPEQHERGELRETGGKAAATGQARAAHD